MIQQEFDYIVIGSGSAGSPLAADLSEDGVSSVAVLESGPSDDHLFVKMPRGVGKLLSESSPHAWVYDVARGGNQPSEIWYKGRTLGGSSSINGMIYARGHQSDFDRWEAAGCTGWGWDDVLPLYREMEDHELGSSEDRGAGGDLKVSIQGSTTVRDAVIDSIASLGVPKVNDVNATLTEAKDGCIGRPAVSIWKGVRQNAAMAFLHPRASQPNLTIMSETRARKLIFDGKKVTGVEIVDADGVHVLKARKEVILCAGAVETPKLLQLSGIGPGAHLQALGIPVLVDSPEVGLNLQEHPGITTMLRITHGSMNQEFRGLRLLANVLKYFMFKSGPMSDAAAEWHGLAKTRPDLERPNVQLFGGLFTMDRTPKGISTEKLPGLSLMGYPLHPTSRGETKIVSSDPDVSPYLNVNYLSTDHDQKTIVELLRLQRKISQQSPLAEFVVSETKPGLAIQSDEDLLDFCKTACSPAYHVAGTCRMGSDAQSVVDPELRVRGVEGLRIADTSIFPELTSGNTSAPAMMVGKKAARLIKQAS